MNQNVLIPQIFIRSDAMLYLWFILVGVGLAVIVAAARQKRHDALGRLLVLGYGFFALTHLMGIQWLLKQWSALSVALKESPGWKIASDAAKAGLVNVIDPPPVEWVLPFHIAFDAFVLLGIWWLTRNRGFEARVA